MKRISVLAALILCLLLLSPLALAESDYYVYDTAGLLTDSQRQSLEQYAGEISQQYGCGVYIVTVENYADYGYSAYNAATNIFTNNNFGLGSDQSGVLLLLSMAERDYALVAHGYGNTAFTDYGKEALTDLFLDNFRSNDWYDGFGDYLSGSEQLLRMAAEGTPYDVPGYSGGSESRGMSAGGKVGISAAIASAISGIACGAMKGKMRSVDTAVTAEEYVLPGGLDMLDAGDVFAYATESRVRVESGRSSSGGGGTTVDSGGFSGKSGKF